MSEGNPRLIWRQPGQVLMETSMLQDVDGRVRYQDVQMFTSRYGGQVLTPEELKDIFTDFDSAHENSITKDEFYMFFSKVSMRQRNSEFNQMVDDMIK